MTAAKPAGQPRVIFCACSHYDVIPRAAREQILAAIQGNGGTPEVVPDLCGLAANRDPWLKTWVDEGHLTIVACFPRAVRWLFHAAGAPLNDKVRLFNMRTQSPQEILRELGIEKESAPSNNHQSSIINYQSDWVPWFPVIDYDRCKSCRQCANFCLFGVYAVSDEGRVEVRKPSGCKTNCPACARMCPHKAIIFPKYGEPHINGDDVSADSGEVAKPPSGDILDRIRERSSGRKRFASQSDAPCPTLDGLRRDLGIPDDVLKSLSPAEVRRITAKPREDSGKSSAQSADRKDGAPNE